MKRIFSPFVLSLAGLPFGCSSSDATVAESAEPVTRDEVRDACTDYCRRVAACDESIDETLCIGTCDFIADKSVESECEAPLHAALECLDRHFCQYGYPSTTDPGSEASTPCNVKAAAVPCLVSTPSELEPAFGFFGTGLGMSAFDGFGAANRGDGSCSAGGGRSTASDGTFEIRCAKSDENYVCSCRIDDRVTRTFETENACPIVPDFTDVASLHWSCGWRY